MMGVRLQVLRFAVVLTANVPDGVVEANTGYVPWVLGENLGGQVDAWVMEQGLGYYPAMDFFRDRPAAVDPALLLLIDEVSTWCTAYAEREIRRRLSRAFSNVQVTQVRATAFGLPHVRPSRDGAPAALASHYAPNRLKAELLLGSIQKGEADVEPLIRRQLNQWLRGPFEQLEIGSLRQLPG